MMDDKALVIEPLQDGGFVVSRRADFRRDPGLASIPMFASTEIGPALSYIAQKLLPQPESPRPEERVVPRPAAEKGPSAYTLRLEDLQA